MGLFFKISQEIQDEFNQKLTKIEEPEDFLQGLIKDLEEKEKKLKRKYDMLVETLSKGKKDKKSDELLKKKNIEFEKELKNIHEKLEAASGRFDFYIARKKRMEAYENISEAMSGLEDLSRYEKLQRVKGEE